jgi:hypothetical protein
MGLRMIDRVRGRDAVVGGGCGFDVGEGRWRRYCGVSGSERVHLSS